MLPKAVAVAVLSSIALAASGCSGGSDAEPESSVDITKFRAELKERFGTAPNEAPWYRHITAITWANGVLEITTDSETRGGVPCGDLWKLAFEQAEPDTPLVVALFSAGGVGLGGCG